MSQGLLLDALDAAVDRAGDAITIEEMNALESRLFHEWLAAERIDDLIVYAHYRFDYGGGVEECGALSRWLVRAGDARRLHRLWRGLIASRLQRFWTEFRHAEQGQVGNIRNAARFKAEALEAMYEYFHAMHQLGETAAVDRLREEMRLLWENRKPKPPPADPRALTEDLFWELIGAAGADAGTAAEFAGRLVPALAAFKPAEIKKFQRMVQESTSALQSWDLWAFAYLARGGCSDDSFDYFRAWVVAQGRAVYEAAVQGPEALAEAAPSRWDFQCEELLHAADEAYQARQGAPLPPARTPAVRMRGEPWRETELPARYPLLWARFTPV